MNERQRQIDAFQKRLEKLLQDQESLSRDIRSLRSDLDKIALRSAAPGFEEKKPSGFEKGGIPSEKENDPRRRVRIPASFKENAEGFIGGNLINKIGIIILILGVGIGIKFAIDRDLVSPLIRLLLGYLAGFILFFAAFRTRKNYLNFSAVLASGSLTILYFITYAGNSYYGILPLSFAYILMIAITVFAIVLSHSYDREVISVIGLVGAYAVPFLLGSRTDNYLVLFLYISIINMGILVVSIRKLWRWLLYSSFSITWLVYISWLKTSYFAANDFVTSIVFAGIYFGLFYLAFINHKFVYNKKFRFEDILLLSANAFIFYGIGYYVLTTYEPAGRFAGLFTLGNALIHLSVSWLLYRRRHPDTGLRQFITGIGLTFITIAIPVELNANWVTLFWFLEAAIMLYIGRSQKIPYYEYFSYVILMLGFYSLMDDWYTAYSSYTAGDPDSRVTPFFNVYFLTGMVAIATVALMNLFHFRKVNDLPLKDTTLKNLVNYGLAGLLVLICYYVFRNEIAIYWNQIYIESEKEVPVALNAESTYLLRNPDMRMFRIVWILIYSLFFAGAVTLLCGRFLKRKELIKPVIVMNIMVLLVFLVQGLYLLSGLRENFLDPEFVRNFNPGKWNIGLSYAGFAAAAILITINGTYVRRNAVEPSMNITVELFTHLAVIWILTSELVHWQELTGAGGSYKIGISILWGVYSLMMVIIGFWKRKKYIRIGAIILFGITLAKLFLYDLADLDTIARTIVFIALGVLLLIISFLYNKYSRVLYD